MIISVSRRCDIPRFQFPWFMERVRTGSCTVANPFNRNQVKTVSLLPEDVDLFVFWTRDVKNILDNADELTERGFRYYVMAGVTGYPVILEPSMLMTSKSLSRIKKLSQKIGQDRIIWRYDPILLTSITNEDFHRRNFSLLAQELQGRVKRVIISVYDEYPAANKRLLGYEKAGHFRLYSKEETETVILPLLADIAKIAESYGMEIQSCAEKDYSLQGIKPGACIDAELINRLWCLEITGKDKNQRPNCLCCKSVDIGAYGICGARCVYCYAWR